MVYSAFTNFVEWFSLNSSKTTEQTGIKLCMGQLHVYQDFEVLK